MHCDSSWYILLVCVEQSELSAMCYEFVLVDPWWEVITMTEDHIICLPTEQNENYVKSPPETKNLSCFESIIFM